MCQDKTAKAPIQLPTSKSLAADTGRISPLNSFPATIALSPDGHYAAMVHAGYGTQDSRGRQSISIANLSNGQVKDFPDDRLAEESHQSYFVGLAFSVDGRHLYASLGSITDPTGSKPGDTGNAIAVYSFSEGKVAPERLIKIAPTKLAAGKLVARGLFNTPEGTAIPYPAGLAVVASEEGERLVVANNYSDSVILIDATSGQVVHQFDLSTNRMIPSAYPYTVVVARDGRRAWCSLWNASQVAELDLASGEVVRRISLRKPESDTAPGSHPTALLLSPDEKTLYVTLSNADQVAAISTADGTPTRWYSTRLHGQAYGGTSPVALAISGDGKQLLVATAMLNSIAVFDLTGSREGAAQAPQEAAGFIPADWYPTALAVHGDDLWIATAKGRGTGPNNGQNGIPPGRRRRDHPYIATLLYGSLGRVHYADASKKLADLTRQVEEGNRLHADAGKFQFAGGANPIKHVIYIIKENRTYDQIFGDIKEANGDPSLTMYGRDITPNEHKLALQFGIYDNFYDSGEVSGNGHDWSTAAISTDYTEANWQVTYRGQERTYDFSGSVAEEYPAERGIPNVDSPQTGYLWVNAAAHGITYRDYGEFIDSEFCPIKTPDASPKEGNPQPQISCEHDAIRKGEPLPAGLGDPKGGPSPYPWPIPLSTQTKATMPELQEHTDLAYPPFNVDYPDQLRADEFLNEFQGFVQARKDGKGEQLPSLVIMHLPNDHTGGTRAGKAAPTASVADNDLALGRIVEAVGHSPYWDDTAIFVLEDDAQDGVDHVDAHRSVVLVISKYAPRSGDSPVLEHRFFTTASVVHSVEELLGLPPMNVNDGYAPLMVGSFSGAGNQAPFAADTSNRENGLIYKVNAAAAKGAKASSRMDFTRPDAVDTRVLNAILWRERKGNIKMPAAKHTVIPAGLKPDDD